MLFGKSVRRYLESRGYALLPWKQFAELTADRERLAGELDAAKCTAQERSDSIVELTDQLEAVKASHQALVAEMDALGVASELRDALHAGMGDDLASAALDRSALQSLFVDQLRAKGISISADEPVFLHVGFGHSGTTSLQLNFFARRSDLFYLGTPYGEAGGLFSALKYLDGRRLNEQQTLEWLRDLVYASPRRTGRPIVVSDETFCDTSEVYYCPRHVPGDTMAKRLKRSFPTAKIIFTIRNQVDYVSSMYFNLKRNYAFLAGVPLPEFSEWWSGMHTQVHGLYLANLDYFEMIDLYGDLFGRENLLILPLEELKTHGARRFLEKICQFMNLELQESDVTDFSVPRNERMTVVESRLAELVTAGSATWSAAVRALVEKESMSSLVAGAPRLAVKFDDEQLRELRRIVVPGNQKLSAEFGLPLGDLGYFV